MVGRWWENGKKWEDVWENHGKMLGKWEDVEKWWEDVEKIWTHHQSHEMYLLKMLGNELVISTLATWCDNHQICRKMVGIWWDNIEVQPQQSGRRLDQWTELCKWAPCPTTIDAEKTYLNMGILMHSYTILYNLIQSYTILYSIYIYIYSEVLY